MSDDQVEEKIEEQAEINSEPLEVRVIEKKEKVEEQDIDYVEFGITDDEIKEFEENEE